MRQKWAEETLSYIIGSLTVTDPAVTRPPLVVFLFIAVLFMMLCGAIKWLWPILWPQYELKESSKVSLSLH